MTLAERSAEYEERAAAIKAIRESAAALAPRGGDLKRIRELRFAMPGFGGDEYARMGDLGWLGLRVPEEKGGVGLGLQELCALCEELGRGLVPEPLVHASLSAWLLADCEDEQVLPALLEGGTLVLTAWQESVDTLVAPGNPGASRLLVPFADAADSFLVPARKEGRLTLGLYPRAAANVETSRTQDGGNYGTVSFDPAGPAASFDCPEDALAQALDHASLATAAYLVGVMDACFALTLEYLKQRNQFGKPIGSFQALQHRAVDHRIRIELSRASVFAAASAIDSGATQKIRQMEVSRAKASASENALLVTRQAIQMHGAIGFTDEYDAGLYLRKAMVLAGQFGSAKYHARRFLELDEQAA